MTRHRRQPRDKAPWEGSGGSRGWLEQVPQLAGSELWGGRHFSGVTGTKECYKCIYKHYIRVLLIKTNQMMYN